MKRGCARCHRQAEEHLELEWCSDPDALIHRAAEAVLKAAKPNHVLMEQRYDIAEAVLKVVL